jgi:hypothetical protein
MSRILFQRPSLLPAQIFNVSALRLGPLFPDGFKQMTQLSSSDLVVILLGLISAALYLFKDQVFTGKAKVAPFAGGKLGGASPNGNGLDSGVDSRDFIAKLKGAVRSRFF